MVRTVKTADASTDASGEAEPQPSVTLDTIMSALGPMVETIQTLDVTVEKLGKKVETITKQQAVMAGDRPATLPVAKTTKEILSGMRRGEARSGQERIDTLGRTPAFRPDDIVRLLPEVLGDKNAKYEALVNAHKIERGDDAYAVIKRFMYARRRDGQRKYIIDYGQGIGEDGAMEYELELVKAAD
jgi:hypothetical protein